MPSYIPSYTAGLTFFIAVAATNLFHQGNWQRVYAAKDYKTLRKSLIISFFHNCTGCFFYGLYRNGFFFNRSQVN